MEISKEKKEGIKEKIERMYGKENFDCCVSEKRLKKYLIKAGYKSLVKLLRLK